MYEITEANKGSYFQKDGETSSVKYIAESLNKVKIGVI